MLIELLAEGAAQDRGRPLVVTASRTAGYGEVHDAALVVAGALRARSIDRFACRVTDVADLLALLGGASAVGAEACLYPRSADDVEVATLAAHFGHHTIVGDEAEGADGADGTCSVADLCADAEPLPALPELDARPLLLLTTGTTGLPKGARNDWGRLVATHRRRTGPADARWLLAHTPNQFAGLGVLLHCVASGATLVVPDSFRPRDALAAMRAHGVTHASATPTFWRFVLNLLRDDAEPPPLRQITMAGEAIPQKLLDDVSARFPSANISQIYGATEFGSSVAVGDGRSGLPARVLERGDDAEVQFRIVDGELHVRSRIGMLGYHGHDDVGDSWRPTGDLVEVRGDRIHFLGRASETINVGGTKVQPLPVEGLMGEVDGVELVHVYGRTSPVTGQIVAADVVLRSDAERDTVDAALRAALRTLPAPSQPRRIRYVDELDVRDTKIARNRGAKA